MGAPHIFTRQPAPELPVELLYCPDCREQWHECGCDLPSYEQVRNLPFRRRG